MIRPHRFMNLEYCFLNITSKIIECLAERNKSSLDNLLEYCKKQYKEVNEIDISLGVSFLYATGKVNYCFKNDIVTLNK